MLRPPKMATPLTTSLLVTGAAGSEPLLGFCCSGCKVLSPQPPKMPTDSSTISQLGGTRISPPPKIVTTSICVCAPRISDWVRSISKPPKIVTISPPTNFLVMRRRFPPQQIFTTFDRGSDESYHSPPPAHCACVGS